MEFAFTSVEKAIVDKISRATLFRTASFALTQTDSPIISPSDDKIFSLKMGALLSAAIILEFFLFPVYFSKGFFHQSRHAKPCSFMSMRVAEDRRVPISSRSQRRRPDIPPEIYTDIESDQSKMAPDDENLEEWAGYMEGFDWQLERARMFFEGPAFAPIRMTLWEPVLTIDKIPKPSFLDQMKILLNNALHMAGFAESMDGAPLVQIVNTFQGSFLQLLSRVADGNLAELAGGPLFLLLQDYYKQYGPVFKLAFGPKSFIVVSDPIMVKHILKDNPLNYDKGILAEILDPIMGKGLIPADPETWKVRRKAIVPGFHKAWLNAMVSHAHNNNHNPPLFLVILSFIFLLDGFVC